MNGELELEVYSGIGQVQRLPLVEGGRVTVGRTQECNVVIQEPGVSRLHCEFTCSSGVAHVANRSSTKSGTQVNGEPVQQALLSSGDEVRVGSRVFVLRRSQPEAPQATESVPEESPRDRTPPLPVKVPARRPISARAPQPRKRRSRYPVDIERARAACVAAGMAMFVVGLGLASGAASSGDAGAGGRIAHAFVQWAKDARGGAFGLSPGEVLGVLSSLHIMTALFVLVLVAIGGRTAYRRVLHVCGPLIGVWGVFTAFALALGGETALGLGLLLAYGVCSVVVLMGVVAAWSEEETNEDMQTEGPLPS